MATVARAVEQAKTTGVLHLNDLGLCTVPSVVWTLTSLVRLDLGGNELTTIPADIGKLGVLQELWLNGNPLHTLPASIERCSHLRFVDLRDTQVAHLPKELSRLPRIADIALSQRSLTPRLAAAYSSGTRALLQHLAHEDELRKLTAALRRRLDLEVYMEFSATAHGKSLLGALVAQVIDTFPDLEELRQVIRNAERLFPRDLDVADAAVIQKRYRQLKRENQKKKLAADVELKLRALYFDVIRVETVEDVVRSIFTHVTELADIRFLLHFAPQLFPERPEDVNGERLLAAIHALRKRRAEERAAATNTLAKALEGLYPDREPPELAALAEAMAKLLKGSVVDLKQLASDASVFFPAEFTSARPRRVHRAYAAAQAEKAADGL